jgi:EAL domain-containing protein (putative c-di-GMP-specific phosphodiesterase class I)
MEVIGQRASDRLEPARPPKRDLALEAAIAACAIRLNFQPQVEVVSNCLVGVEALARWQPEPSSEFMFARAAAAGLGERLSRHVQASAIATAACWDGPLANIRLSLNCVAADLARPNYGHWLIAECSRMGFAPSRLTLEITESSLVIDRKLAAAKLGWLREWGVRIAIDDFGTGYANLPYLTALPLDTLKLDRELIAGLENERSRIVVRAMIAMARDLGLETCAEGVETLSQREMLAEWGCATMQGYLIAPALEERDLTIFAGTEAVAV